MKLRLLFAGHTSATDTWRMLRAEHANIMANFIIGTPSIRGGL